MICRDAEETEITQRSATDVYAEFLEQVLAGEPVVLDQWIEAHPHLADELRRLHEEANWVRERLEQVQVDADPGQELPTVPALSDPAVDADFGYQVLREIGRGGMGVVLAVWDRALRRQIALKTAIEPGITSEPPQLRPDRLVRFLSEAQITGQLEHPGIVPVYELGSDDQGSSYFTMRLVKGESLHEILDDSPGQEEGRTLPRVVGILLKACEAVAYAHSKGVIHRDLKPANIMVGRFGEVYVMDWGLAKVVGRQEIRDLKIRVHANDDSMTVRTERDVLKDDEDSPLLTLDGTVVGTPVYMSPEQAMGKEVGPESDVYALGCILYQVLTGARPYMIDGVRMSPRMVLAALLSGPPKPVRKKARRAPPELVSICEKAMRRDPSERYRDTMELASDLRAFLEERVVRAHGSGAVAEFAKWVYRNRAVAALLLIAMVLTGYFAVSRHFKSLEVAQALEVTRRHADLTNAQYLIEEETTLWPCRAEMLPRLDQWLFDVVDVLSRAPVHQQYLASLPDDQGVDRSRWMDHLERLDRLESLFDDVSGRRELAQSIRESTIDEHWELWDEVILSVADGSVYADIELEPQVGLVPLGRDDRTLFWEFWHIESGERPEKNGLGEYVIEEETGMVFVLLPGGEYWRGAQSASPAEPNYEQALGSHSQAVERLTVEPFFVSKYEVTLAQWIRMSGHTPSRWTENQIRVMYSLLRCPVDTVSWDGCMQILERFQLTLPDEAQWEYAARAGTNTPFWFGSEADALADHENTADQQYGVLFGAADVPPWKDGYGFASPVGSMRPNPFGLHDILGNLSEWTLNTYEKSGADIPEATVRGGSYDGPPSSARCSFRAPYPKHVGAEFIGFRPVWKWVP